MRIISGKQTILETASEFLQDESKLQGGIPDTIFFPECIEEVQQIIRNAANTQTPATFIGGRTGTTGGATCTEGCIAISFSAMNKILSVNHTSEGSVVLTCQPGVTLSTIKTFLSDPALYPSHITGQETLGKNRFFYPPDPTETNAHLGGTIAANASGARSLRFGPTRSHVHQLSIVHGNGALLSLTRGYYPLQKEGFLVYNQDGSSFIIPKLDYDTPSTKNASGYYCQPKPDCIDYIIGSEGTLGAIVQIGILLQPSKTILSGLSFFPSRNAAFNFADYLRTEQSIISIEYFDSSALNFINLYRKRFPDWLPSFPKDTATAIFWEWSEQDPHLFEDRLEVFESNLEQQGSSLDNTWSGFNEAEQLLLKRFRHALPETINAIVAQNKVTYPEIRKIGTDSAIPASHFYELFSRSVELIEKNQLQYAVFGHLGDYHLHINLLPSSGEKLSIALQVYDELMNMAISAGGTVSAEHGIGKIKRKYLVQMYDSDAISQMNRLKNVFDPGRIFSPGNLLQ